MSKFFDETMQGLLAAVAIKNSGTSTGENNIAQSEVSECILREETPTVTLQL